MSLNDVDLANLQVFFEEHLIKTKRIVGTIDSRDYIKLLDLLTEVEIGQMLWECFQYDICHVRRDEDDFEHRGPNLRLSVDRVLKEENGISCIYAKNNIGSIYCRPFTSEATIEEIKHYTLMKEQEYNKAMNSFKSKILAVYEKVDSLRKLIDKKKENIGELIAQKEQKIIGLIFLLVAVAICGFCWYQMESFQLGLICGTLLVLVI